MIFSPNGLHEPSVLYCTSKIRGKRENVQDGGEEKERDDLKEESETKTKMVLRAKNPRIAMVREQWVHCRRI